MANTKPIEMKTLINQLQLELQEVKMPAEQKAVITTLIDQIQQKGHELEVQNDRLMMAAAMNQVVIQRLEAGYKTVEQEVDKIAADLKTTKQWT